MPITQELQTAQRLQKAGLSAEASAVIAEKLEEAATLAQATAFDRFRAELRAEMGAMRVDMAEFRAEMRSEMAEFRAEMRSEMAEFRAEMRDKIGEVREKVSEVRVEVARTRADLEHSMRVMQSVLLSAIALAVAILAGAPALARFLSH
jgi:hypothetical protein